jgi:prepilin-type N-terminal cleavage/methylation domain-containing protein
LNFGYLKTAKGSDHGGKTTMHRSKSGFTLVEVIIAMAVVAIAIFGLVSVITYTTRGNMATKERMLALRAAERKIEQMMTTSPFSDIVDKYNNATPGWGVDDVEYLSPITGQTHTIFVEFPLGAAPNTLNETITGNGPSGSDPGWMELGSSPGGYAMYGGGTQLHLDLNGNGNTTDVAVPSTACQIIPVRVRVRWKGIYGSSEFVYKYTFLKKA